MNTLGINSSNFISNIILSGGRGSSLYQYPLSQRKGGWDLGIRLPHIHYTSYQYNIIIMCRLVLLVLSLDNNTHSYIPWEKHRHFKSKRASGL